MPHLLPLPQQFLSGHNQSEVRKGRWQSAA